MMTSNERTFVAGLLAGIYLGEGQSGKSGKDLEDWESFVRDSSDLILRYRQEEPGAADDLYDLLGRYEPARYALTVILDTTSGPEAGGAFQSAPDPLMNVAVIYEEYVLGERAEAGDPVPPSWTEPNR